VDGNEVVSEGGVRDSAGSGVGDGLLEQRLADAADGAADDLAAGQLVVEDPPGVDHRHDAGHVEQAEPGVDAHLDELGRETNLAAKGPDSATSACWGSGGVLVPSAGSSSRRCRARMSV
jgi:hypothetical protein